MSLTLWVTLVKVGQPAIQAENFLEELWLKGVKNED